MVVDKKEDIQFNRLVLVGNGFDLALGLKTGYNDFLLWLQKKYLILALEGKPVYSHEGKSYNVGYLNNDTFEIGINYKFSNFSYRVEIENFENLDAFRKFLKASNIDFKIKSNLLNLILEHNNELGWVDIESLFYKELKKCFGKKTENIMRVNRELEFLSIELEIYLSEYTIEPNGWEQFGRTLNNQVTREIKNMELEVEYLLNKDKLPEVIYFLNFNYTNALFNITQDLKSWSHTKDIKLNWNPIHGQINKAETPIIFGFGDETDKDYEKIEDLNNNRYFEHIKSFKYSQTSNYQDLIKFLDSAYYQVCIYGHSCGLSDRTMLKEIFEHQNCKSIKIFYYKRPDGSDDFLEKTMEISRHFSDKASMRRKVVNKEYSQEMPQNNL